MKTDEALGIFEVWMKQQRLRPRTRKTYCGHVRRFGRFKVASGTSAEEKVSAYLSWLAANRSAVTPRKMLAIEILRKDGSTFLALSHPGHSPAVWSMQNRRFATAFKRELRANGIKGRIVPILYTEPTVIKE